MTSSLVGSEMCIRDRSDLGSASGVRVSCQNAFVYSRLLTAVAAACDFAVSYTHLTLPTICSV
eukprot:1765007-Prorocentrum_lima.AAC.1